MTKLLFFAALDGFGYVQIAKKKKILVINL